MKPIILSLFAITVLFANSAEAKKKPLHEIDTSRIALVEDLVTSKGFDFIVSGYLDGYLSRTQIGYRFSPADSLVFRPTRYKAPKRDRWQYEYDKDKRGNWVVYTHRTWFIRTYNKYSPGESITEMIIPPDGRNCSLRIYSPDGSKFYRGTIEPSILSDPIKEVNEIWREAR